MAPQKSPNHNNSLKTRRDTPLSLLRRGPSPTLGYSLAEQLKLKFCGATKYATSPRPRIMKPAPRLFLLGRNHVSAIDASFAGLQLSSRQGVKMLIVGNGLM